MKTDSKLVEIFVKLIDGTQVWVPLKAKHIKDFEFIIIENTYLDLNMDFTSVWEFFPQDRVKCFLKNGSFFAYELIDSEMPNRKYYSLIYEIVSNHGQIGKLSFKIFSNEITELINNKRNIYLKNIIIRNWIEKHKNGK